MIRFLTLILIVPLAALAADPDPCPEPEDATAADLKKLQGNWQLTKAMRKGKASNKIGTMVIAKTAMTLNDGTRDEKVSFKLNGKKNPREIDLEVGNGQKTVLGVYKLDKDEWTICFGEPGGARPKKIDENASGFLVFKKTPAKK